MAYRRRIFRRRPKRRIVRARRRLPGLRRTGGLYRPFRSMLPARRELKYQDYQWDLLNISNLWSNVTINDEIPLGTGIQDRLSTRIMCKRLLIRGPVTINQTTPADIPNTQALFCRFVIVYDRQNNSGTAPAAQVFDGTDFLSTSVVPYANMFNNIENKYRFKILADKRFTLSPGVTLGTYINWAIPLNCLTQFDNTGGAVTYANVKTGVIQMFYTCYPMNFPSSPPTVSFQFTQRLRFVDV